MTNIINHEVFEKQFFENIKADMLEVAEPVLQQALKEIETKMRKKLAEHLISRIQTDYAISYQANVMEIRVKQADH